MVSDEPPGEVFVQTRGLEVPFRILTTQIERYWDWAGERELEWFYEMGTAGNEWMDFEERRFLRKRSFINEPGSDSGRGDQPIEVMEEKDNLTIALEEK